MARGNTLTNVLAMVKAELAYSLTSGVATAQDQELYSLIDGKQQWLAGEYDWPFLHTSADVTASSRYATLPTTIDYARLFNVWVFWSNYWKPLEYGIDEIQYNALSSGDVVAAVPRDPIMRWSYKSDGASFEVWPVPVTSQTVRFTGVRTLTTLKSGGVYSGAATLDLDDQMIVLFVAAEKLARIKPEQAKLKLDLANQRIRTMRATAQVKSRITDLVPNENENQRRVVPLITTA